MGNCCCIDTAELVRACLEREHRRPGGQLSNDASDFPDLAFSFEGHWLATARRR